MYKYEEIGLVDKWQREKSNRFPYIPIVLLTQMNHHQYFFYS